MSKRDDTCSGRHCPFWIKYGEHCPNFQAGVFETVEGHTYQTKDCAPKRSMIMIQELYNMMLATRQDANRATNANIKLVRHLERVFDSQPELDAPLDAELLEDNHVKDST